MLSLELKNKVQTIREELKKVGFTTKQASVKAKSNGYDDYITITIKDLKASKSDIESIVNKYNKVEYCETSGEILQGCNTFVNVLFDYDVIEEASKEFLEIAQNVIKESKNNTNLYVVAETEDKYILYSAEYNEMRLSKRENGMSTKIKSIEVFNIEGIAKALAMFVYQYGFNLNEIEEVSEVEQIKSESQEIINSINIETLETQNESLENVSQQLDKVNKAIENNINNEEIRLQLRDVENDLKYHYSSLDEMIEQQQTEKKKVTHNEYENICKELASRVYEKDETKITMKEYDQMLDNYEILPFEINIDNEELKKIINTYADNESIEADRMIYSGSIDKSILYNLLNDSEGYKDLYIEYYQMIICNDKLKVILTYCEGDFIAEVYNSELTYNEGIKRTRNFIEEM